MSLDYILPLKADVDGDVQELSEYLHRLSPHANVIVVDGSPQGAFEAHAAMWATVVTHVRPDPDLVFTNGKVNGVITGFRRSQSDKAVVADDDVRYEPEQLRFLAALLDTDDLIRPQNYFEPLPWHARWDTARSLLNRAVLGADFPGTLAMRLTPRLRSHGYDGNVLFENLELIRTIQAQGGQERVVLDLFIRRLPPTTRHFVGQRLRQAYDSFAQPHRMVFELALLPIIGLCGLRGRRLVLLVAAAVATAERGRRRGRGTTVYPPSTSLFAPAWIAERALCSWLALVMRARGGVTYSNRRIALAAHSLIDLEGNTDARG
jgi:hypothetical protein